MSTLASNRVELEATVKAFSQRLVDNLSVDVRESCNRNRGKYDRQNYQP